MNLSKVTAAVHAVYSQRFLSFTFLTIEVFIHKRNKKWAKTTSFFFAWKNHENLMTRMSLFDYEKAFVILTSPVFLFKAFIL